MKPEPSIIAQAVHRTPWWTIPAFIVMAVFLTLVLVCAVLWDFGRWLLSGIFPVYQGPAERPGDPWVRRIGR